MLEAVPNVSEGRDPEVLAALEAACGESLLDVHVDADHNRSVFTLAGPAHYDASASVRSLARAVTRHVDLTLHAGVHPRFGALDVVPFVALAATTADRARAVEAALSFARWWAEAYEVPVFCYDEADSEGHPLPYVRRHAFRTRLPDFGPAAPHPTLGATAVGARKPLLAVNCVLVTSEVEVARRVARGVRETDGGLPGVRSLGLFLEARERPQVSMNLVDLDRTGLQDAVLAVRDLARAEGSDVAEVELVGLVPRAELDRCSDDFLRWSGLDSSVTVEARLHRAG